MSYNNPMILPIKMFYTILFHQNVISIDFLIAKCHTKLIEIELAEQHKF